MSRRVIPDAFGAASGGEQSPEVEEMSILLKGDEEHGAQRDLYW
jgi:hypothetical protein